jgi:iron complex outermembrane receptor protein
MAVSALDSKALERTIARDLQDIQDMSPNIMIDPILGNGTISFMSRGINMDDVEQSFDPAVGVVIDGLHIGTATGSLMSLWDVEQVEMLRGPQGTLFGKNTIGGVLNITRSRPTGELGGKVAMTIGQWERRDVKGVLNLPRMLNDTLSAKLSFVRLDGGGYFDNIVRGEQEGDEDYVGGGITLLWEPSDSLEVLLTHYIDRSDTPTRPVTSLSVTQSGNADAASIAGGQPACLFDPASCDHPYTESGY